MIPSEPRISNRNQNPGYQIEILSKREELKERERERERPGRKLG